MSSASYCIFLNNETCFNSSKIITSKILFTGNTFDRRRWYSSTLQKTGWFLWSAYQNIVSIDSYECHISEMRLRTERRSATILIDFFTRATFPRGGSPWKDLTCWGGKKRNIFAVWRYPRSGSFEVAIASTQWRKISRRKRDEVNGNHET